MWAHTMGAAGLSAPIQRRSSLEKQLAYSVGLQAHGMRSVSFPKAAHLSSATGNYRSHRATTQLISVAIFARCSNCRAEVSGNKTGLASILAPLRRLCYSGPHQYGDRDYCRDACG